jgi:putative tryptophan/tyrosine transport system substrate-binding protein
MRRREFIAGLGSAAAWPMLARAQQQPAMPVIGYLRVATIAANLAAFRKGLSEQGFTEGRNVAFEFRASEDYEQLPALAAELVRRQVAVIVTEGNFNAAQAAKAATETIPVMFSLGADPVRLGLVASLNRPGGNITGVTFLGNELEPKRLEVLRQLVPQATTIAFLVNPTNSGGDSSTRDMEAAARSVRQPIVVVGAGTASEIETAFASLVEQNVRGLIISADAFFASRRSQIIALAARQAVPTIYFSREFAADGGLMSYGDDRLESLRQAGIYAGRILKGEKPADLPIAQPTKFELVINLKTAKALGLTIPETLLATADEVIQ